MTSLALNARVYQSSRALLPSERQVRPIASAAELAWLYVVQCRDACKIGITSGKLAARLQAMQGGNPYPMRIVFARQAPMRAALNAELAAMRMLEHRHIHGEWFRVPRADAILAAERALAAD